MTEETKAATDFGADVFGEEAIRTYLSKDTAKKLQATIREGKPLDPSIAGEVAHGIRHWAMDRGATHYTHWFLPMTGATAEKHDSFLELKDECLNVSAVKKSEDGEGWVVRLFNPSDKAVKTAIRLNGGIAPIDTPQSPVERQQAEFELPAYSGKAWKEVKLVTLEELDDKALTMNADGFVDFEITGKKILTIKFVG